ncbi:MAG: hypothetical protein KDD62_03525 [Bdellovibrionales bacterium]|nr:hypothetical protein [Bdellovibrionales bacterium]
MSSSTRFNDRKTQFAPWASSSPGSTLDQMSADSQVTRSLRSQSTRLVGKGVEVTQIYAEMPYQINKCLLNANRTNSGVCTTSLDEHFPFNYPVDRDYAVEGTVAFSMPAKSSRYASKPLDCHIPDCLLQNRRYITSVYHGDTAHRIDKKVNPEYQQSLILIEGGANVIHFPVGTDFQEVKQKHGDSAIVVSNSEGVYVVSPTQTAQKLPTLPEKYTGWNTASYVSSEGISAIAIQAGLYTWPTDVWLKINRHNELFIDQVREEEGSQASTSTRGGETLGIMLREVDEVVLGEPVLFEICSSNRRDNRAIYVPDNAAVYAIANDALLRQEASEATFILPERERYLLPAGVIARKIELPTAPDKESMLEELKEKFPHDILVVEHGMGEVLRLTIPNGQLQPEVPRLV